MLNKYNDFILEKLLMESVIHFAPPFRKNLGKIKDEPIAKKLLDIERDNIKPDITFVNLDKEGYVSFTTMKNAKKILSTQFKMPEDRMENILDNDEEIGDDIWKLHTLEYNLRHYSPLNGMGEIGQGDPYEKARNPVKLGRFVNNILPGEFTAKEVEDFVNKFKAALEQSGEKFIEVSGEEIGDYYDHKKYAKMSGTLGSSCMAKQESSIFQIYMDNPEVCRMLVLLEDDLVIGRALIWKLETSDNAAEYFLDRQYTIKESDVEKFRKYAIENGWSYKTYNNHTNLGSVTYNDESKTIKMTVKVKKNNYDEFPYVDTFRRYDPNTGILYNDNENGEESIGNYILASTSGGYEIVSDDVWSDWHDCHIDRDEAVFSAPLQDWIYRSYAEEVTVGSTRRRGYYPEGYDDIVYLDHENTYCHHDDAVWSEYNNEYYLDGTTIDTIVRIDENTAEPEEYNYTVYEPFPKWAKDIILVEDLVKKEWFIRLSNVYSDWSNTDAVHKDLLTKDYKDEYILDIFTVDTFLIKTDNEKDHFYLTKEDVVLFGYELETKEVDDVANTRATDWFDYYKELKSYENNVSLFRDKPIIKLKELFSKIETYAKYGEEYDNLPYEIKAVDWDSRNKLIKEFIQDEEE
jgi:hypothetical protein